MEKQINSDEKEITKLYYKKRITLRKYKQLLENIATSRNEEIISGKKNRRSMSSSKWN